MNVLLTGASRGIGYQIALELAKKDISKLVLIARNGNKLQELKEKCKSVNKNIAVFIIESDILEWQNISNELNKIEKLDSIDVLINNAGLLINKEFNSFTIEESRYLFDVNFHAPAQLIKLFMPLLEKSSNAHVVNIGSIGGFQGSSKFSGLSYYSASKAALMCMTESLASEYVESPVKFNCLALGAVQTEMLSEAFPGYKAPINAANMGAYIADFSLEGHKYYNGQILPVRLSNP